MAIVKCPSCGTAISVPDKKTGLWWGIGCLIATLGIPVIVAVFGLLAAIAIPSFVKARETSQQNACINNMRMLESAKESAALQHNRNAGDTISEEEISPFLKNGFTGLICPRGGHYTINPVGQEAECSVHGSMSGAHPTRAPPPNEASPDSSADDAPELER